MARTLAALLLVLALWPAPGTHAQTDTTATGPGSGAEAADPGLAPPAPIVGSFGGFSCDTPHPGVLDHPTCKRWRAEYDKWRAAYDAYHKRKGGG